MHFSYLKKKGDRGPKKEEKKKRCKPPKMAETCCQCLFCTWYRWFYLEILETEHEFRSIQASPSYIKGVHVTQFEYILTFFYFACLSQIQF